MRGGIATLLLACVAGALATAAPWPQAHAAQRFERGLLWKIEGAGARPSHIFGTIHLDDRRVTRLPDAVAQSLDAADSFTMEVSLEPGNVLQLANRMVFQDGRDLPGIIGRPMYERLTAASAKMGLPEEAMRMFRPWAAVLLLSMPRQNPEEILDNVLFRIAAQQKKPVHQLESVDEQVEAFEGLPEADQVAMLLHTLEHHDSLPQMREKLLDAYLQRDLAAMWRISGEGGDDQSKRLRQSFMRRLLDERNTRMAERMQPRLRAGNAFIAVGALHLYGENGLLSLLAQRGYQLTRVY
jgi:uncharacterized protein